MASSPQFLAAGHSKTSWSSSSSLSPFGFSAFHSLLCFSLCKLSKYLLCIKIRLVTLWLYTLVLAVQFVPWPASHKHARTCCALLSCYISHQGFRLLKFLSTQRPAAHYLSWPGRLWQRQVPAARASQLIGGRLSCKGEKWHNCEKHAALSPMERFCGGERRRGTL